MRARQVYELFSSYWRCKWPWFIKEIKPGIFQLRFDLKGDKDRILDGKPWTCKGSQLVFQQWPKILTIEEVEFVSSPFYHLHNGSTPEFLNERSGRQMAAMGRIVIGFTRRYASSMRLEVVGYSSSMKN